MDSTRHAAYFDFAAIPWDKRLAFVVETMRDLSRQTEPQAMVQAYSKRMRQIMPSDRHLSLSRRGLVAPQFRITRSSSWDAAIDPWKQRDQLPVLSGGVLSDLIYGDEPKLIEDLHPSPDDPAAPFMEGMRSLVAVPLFENGTAINMVVLMRGQPNAFRREQMPEHVWMANLFGRATHNLVLSQELKAAYDLVDREMQVVADIQRSLLPTTLPNIPTLELASYYQTSRRAGGDYYDFFPLPDGQWGILIADVSGHGTPAAVLMAVTHSIAHAHHGPPQPPGTLLTYINDNLTRRYTGDTGKFVTAFYGIYDPARRQLTYASAGHNPPRIRHAGVSALRSMEADVNLPLGIFPGVEYRNTVEMLGLGDLVLLYTDGITEARAPDGDLFGVERLDELLMNYEGGAGGLINKITAVIETFTEGRPPTDDRTMLALKVS